MYAGPSQDLRNTEVMSPNSPSTSPPRCQKCNLLWQRLFSVHMHISRRVLSIKVHAHTHMFDLWSVHLCFYMGTKGNIQLFSVYLLFVFCLWMLKTLRWGLVMLYKMHNCTTVTNKKSLLCNTRNVTLKKEYNSLLSIYFILLALSGESESLHADRMSVKCLYGQLQIL